MIIYTKNDSSLNIPVGLGPNVGPLDASLVQLEVDSSTVAQSIMPSGDGFSSVTVNPYTLESVTINSSTAQQVITPQNADGLSSVTVNPYYLAHTEESITQNGQYVIAASDYGADGLADVTLDVSVESSYNWIIEARKGTLSDLSGYSLEVPTRDHQYNYLLAYSPITQVPRITGNITQRAAFASCFQGCTSLTDVTIDASGLTGESCFASAFLGTDVTSVSFPNLESVGFWAFARMFSACHSLERISLPKLSNILSDSWCYNIYDSHTSGLKYLEIHPDALTGTTDNNNITRGQAWVSVTLTAPITKDCYIYGSGGRFTRDSAFGILQMIDLTVSMPGTVYLPSMHFEDYEDGRMQTAYDAAINAGWTITGLTITPYS